MELAIKNISDDKIVRTKISTRLKRFQLTTFGNTSYKRKTISFYKACHWKSFRSNGDDIVELSIENERLKKKQFLMLEKNWCESLEKFNDAKRANLLMSRMEKQMEKQR